MPRVDATASIKRVRLAPEHDNLVTTLVQQRSSKLLADVVDLSSLSWESSVGDVLAAALKGLGGWGGRSRASDAVAGAPPQTTGCTGRSLGPRIRSARCIFFLLGAALMTG